MATDALPRLCRCLCGRDVTGALGPCEPHAKDTLCAMGVVAAHNSNLHTTFESGPMPDPPRAVDVQSFSLMADQPLRGDPVYQGQLFHLLAEETAELVSFSLYVNGFAFSHNGDEVTVSLSPFSFVRTCKFEVTSSNATFAEMKIFKISLFTQGACYYYGVRGEDEYAAEVERQRWVVRVAKAVQVVTQSLFPPFRISCWPVPSAATTKRRLMAGYLLYHDGDYVATVLYCELHPHCNSKDRAQLAFYENELCQKQVMVLVVTVQTVCCEKVGVNCSCFSVDSHQFSTRTTAERKLWLRAISNIKVKLSNHAPSPDDEEIGHYRHAIEEHIENIRGVLEGFVPTDALLRPVPRPSGCPGFSMQEMQESRTPRRERESVLSSSAELPRPGDMPISSPSSFEAHAVGSSPQPSYRGGDADAAAGRRLNAVGASSSTFANGMARCGGSSSSTASALPPMKDSLVQERQGATRKAADSSSRKCCKDSEGPCESSAKEAMAAEAARIIASEADCMNEASVDEPRGADRTRRAHALKVTSLGHRAVWIPRPVPQPGMRSL